MGHDLILYGQLLNAVKERIRQAQIKAALSANAEMILTYWDIGRMIDERQKDEGWGANVIPRLAKDIRNDLLEVKGFSERNIGRMIAFYREYSEQNHFLPQAVAKMTLPVIQDTVSVSVENPAILPQVVAKNKENVFLNVLRFVAQIPWGHNILLMEKIKDLSIRFWYVQQTIDQGWSRESLTSMIKSKAFERNGTAITNFKYCLPAHQSDLAHQILKDPYIFDFLTLEEPFHERELETGLVRHLEKFLLELGAGFAFVGRQYHMEISDKDFYLDLLFYHLRLRCFVVIDLKKGDFKPEYAGKINFYCPIWKNLEDLDYGQ
jgi:predicted nuclease of restriction endonuclease-like (RecB) superfamily